MVARISNPEWLAYLQLPPDLRSIRIGMTIFDFNVKSLTSPFLQRKQRRMETQNLSSLADCGASFLPTVDIYWFTCTFSWLTSGSQQLQPMPEKLGICFDHEDCRGRLTRIKLTKGFKAKEAVEGHMASFPSKLEIFLSFSENELSNLFI